MKHLNVTPRAHGFAVQNRVAHVDTQQAIDAIATQHSGLAVKAFGSSSPASSNTALKTPFLQDDTTHPQTLLLERFEACIAQHPYSPKTRKNYKNAFRSFLADIAPQLPLELSKQAVEDWLARRLAARQSSSAHQNTLINAIKFYYGAVENCLASRYAFERPKQNMAEPMTLTKLEVQRILASTSNIKHRCLLLLAYSTGLRLREVLGLCSQDINLDRMTISITAAAKKSTKRKLDREVPLSPKLQEVLQLYFAACNPQVWLFEGEQRGQPYSERSAQMVVNKAAKRARIDRPVTMHMLRNSYATHQLEAGIAVEAVQDLMGHKSIRSTGRYAQIARHKWPASPADDMDI